MSGSPKISAILSLIAIVVCGVLWWRSLSSADGPHGKWGYDLTTAELFEVPATAVPPYAAPSGPEQGVDAQVFRDRNGKRSVISLRRYSPEAAQVMHSIIAQEPLADARKAMETVHRGTLLRGVDATAWVEEISPAGVTLLQTNAARIAAEELVVDLP